MTGLPGSLYPEGYRDPPWDGSEAQFRDIVLPARTEAIGRTLNESLDLPEGVRFALEFGRGILGPDDLIPEPWMRPFIDMELRGECFQSAETRLCERCRVRPFTFVQWEMLLCPECLVAEGEERVEFEALREVNLREIIKAFGVKPWQVGVGQVPWRVRFWRRVSFARWRVARRRARDASGRP